MDEAIIAASRFGYGSGPGKPAPTGDARQWVRSQLDRPVLPAAFAGMPDATSTLVALERERRQEREQAKQQGDPDRAADKSMEDGRRKEIREDYLREVGARYQAAIASDTPFVERLAAFWANHFTVSGVRPEVRPVAGAFEREAIRPHMLGKFETMVLAVVMHPVMGRYLDNAVSVGPNSRAGQRNKKGLNENLGRELLELHTLGVDGGYTEEDVRALARILTGWGIGRLQDPDAGKFRFYPQLHEPGPQVLLGRTYADEGMGQGLAAIHDIAVHPSTARHIARKLARHFVADDPPPSAVDRLAAAFRESGGDLRHVSATLAELPEAWSAWQDKVKTPWDLVVSASIATGLTLPPDLLASFLERLGQPVFMAPQPAGWPDDAVSWIGPEAVLRRVEWCAAFADRTDKTLDPETVAAQALGGALDPAAHEAIGRAESRTQAVAMLLATPQFQRR
ncbi:MAG TPA: DUF1800 domain-containing protein [Stellaceae bacterium]|nr:DUF1800 domain-containing protein [Stellaceae bacterium]